jgi:hypothetical protein
LSAVTVAEQLPFFSEEVLLVPQDSRTSTQEVTQHDQKVRLLVGLVEYLREQLYGGRGTLSGLNGSREIVITLATGSSLTSTLSSDSLSELYENSILLRGGAFFLVFF